MPKYNLSKLESLVRIEEVIVRVGGTPPRGRENISCVFPENHEHGDKNGSMSVRNNMCRCFKCQETYTPISLYIKKTYGINYKDLPFDAKKQYADEFASAFGVNKNEYTEPTPYELNQKLKEEGKIREDIYRYADFCPFRLSDLKALGLRLDNSYGETVMVTLKDYYIAKCGCIPPRAEPLLNPDGTNAVKLIPLDTASFYGIDFEPMEAGVSANDLINQWDTLNVRSVSESAAEREKTNGEKTSIENEVKRRCVEKINLDSISIAEINGQLSEYDAKGDKYKQYLFDNYLAAKLEKECRSDSVKPLAEVFSERTDLPEVNYDDVKNYERFESLLKQRKELTTEKLMLSDIYTRITDHQYERLEEYSKELKSEKQAAYKMQSLNYKE